MKTSTYHIKEFDVSEKEILITIVIFILIGGAILGYFFIRRASLMIPSSINVIVTTGVPAEPTVAISKISVNNVTPSSGILHWSISESLPVIIQYGIKQDQLLGELRVAPGETSVSLTNLFPRTRYYFRLVAESKNSTPIVSDTYSFVTSD